MGSFYPSLVSLISIFLSVFIQFLVYLLLKIKVNPVNRKCLRFLPIVVQLLAYSLSASISGNYHILTPGYKNIVGNVKSFESGTIEIEKVKFFENGEWKKSRNRIYLSVYVENPNIFSNMKIFFGGEVECRNGFYFCRAKSGREWYCDILNNSFADSILVTANKFAADYSGFAEEKIGIDNASFISSLLLGINIDRDTKKMIRNSGLSYLFVVSGIHFYMAYFIISFFMSFIVKINVIRDAAVFFLLFSYLMLCGISPPALRAFFFILIFTLIGKIDYPVKRINILGLVFMFQMLIDYSSVFDVSLYLSYSATFGIIIFSRYGNYKNGYMNSVISVIGAILFTMPLTSFYFQSFPFLSLIFGLFFSGISVFVILPPLFFSLAFFILKMEIPASLILLGINPLIIIFRKLIEIFSENNGSIKSGEYTLLFEIFLLVFIIIFFERKRYYDLHEKSR